jgi:hypothetical protein
MSQLDILCLSCEAARDLCDQHAAQLTLTDRYRDLAEKFGLDDGEL